jgi:hypothetical protein
MPRARFAASAVFACAALLLSCAGSAHGYKYEVSHHT